MNKSYLLTRLEHDDTTHYLSHWCESTISLAEKQGLKVIDLHREKANKKEILHYAGGLSEFVAHINKTKSILHKPIYFKRQEIFSFF